MERATVLETWKPVPDSHEAAKDLVNALGESLQSLKRKSQQELEEARVEKRIKVESSAGVKVESRDGLSCSSVNENGVDPMVPVLDVEGCQETNIGNDLTEEVDELRPVVQGDEISIAVGNGTDLSDLLRGLDDSGDSEDEDEEFGGDPLSWPSLEIDFRNELIGYGNVSIPEVQAQMPLAEPVENGVDISSGSEKRDDIRIEVEVHAHKTMNKEKASPEVITLDSDSDDDEDLVMYDRLDGASQLNNTVRSESGGSRQVPKESSELENAVTQEPGSSRQVPNECPLVANVVKIEYGSASQVPNARPQLEIPVSNASPKVGTVVKVEHGSARQVPDASPQVGTVVKVEHGSARQVPDASPQMGTVVKVEHGSARQVPDASPQVGNPVPNASPQVGNAMNANPQVGNPVSNASPQVGNAVNANPQVGNPVPNASPQVGNAVNANPQVENSVKVEHGSTGQVLHNMQSPHFQVNTLQNILTPAQQQAGNVVQVRVVDGKLQPYVRKPPAIPQNTSRMPISPFGGNVMHPMIREAYAWCRPSGPSTSFVPINGHVQEATSGEQAGRSQGLNHPTTSAIVLSVGAQAGGHGWNPRTTSAAVPSLGLQARPIHGWKPRMTAAAGELAGPSHYWRPRMTSATAPPSGEQAGQNSSTTSASGDQAGPSHAWNPPSTSAGVCSSGDQAGPSHGWNPPSTSAIVPYSGSNKAEPGLYDNTNLGPQNVPAHNQLAVVKPCYDSTVSTPRINVARAMQQYDAFIAKAKHDRIKEALARTASNPNEIVREGLKRGLECRPDIVAYNDMKKDFVNPAITVGDLPGIEIGDRFTYRHQMAVIGLHRLPNVGIDYGHPPPDMIPTATAIVLMPKAGYVDDKDYGNTILYTGQGGRKKRNQQAPFVCDQELKKGNLALAKNYERKLPVRVIRGHSVLGSSGPGVLGYTYDGLYIITSYEFSLGMNGFNVYKYSLERLEGQPPIPPCIAGCTAHEWNTARGALGALPLQVMDPPPLDPNEDVKHLCN